MKPYPLTGLTEEERLFNYRLSHFRRISKNTFGIWSNRSRLFLTRICMQPEKSYILHLSINRVTQSFTYKIKKFIYSVRVCWWGRDDGRIYEGEWRKQIHTFNYLLSLSLIHSQKSTAVIGIRNLFKQYICGAGSVPWQWKHLL